MDKLPEPLEKLASSDVKLKLEEPNATKSILIGYLEKEKRYVLGPSDDGILDSIWDIRDCGDEYYMSGGFSSKTNPSNELLSTKVNIRSHSNEEDLTSYDIYLKNKDMPKDIQYQTIDSLVYLQISKDLREAYKRKVESN